MTEISEKEWPALKKALWRVLMDENLNDGHYIKAFDLVERLYEAAAHARAEASDQYKNVEPGKSWNAAYSSHARARWREETIQILAELQHGFRDSDIEAIADRIHAASQKGAPSDE